MPWYMYFAISGLLLGVALALSLVQYAVTRDNRGMRATRIAGVVLACILGCVSAMLVIAMSCGVTLV